MIANPIILIEGMSDTALQRAGGFALIVCGTAAAAFWAMAAYAGTFAGAAVVQTPSWIVEHSLHVLSALLGVFGFIALFAAQREEAGLLGVVGFVLATIGNVLFLADGIIALVIFPALARNDPTLLELSGAMSQGAVRGFFNRPPGPAPMIALAIGGSFWALSAIWLGLLLVKRAGSQ